MVLGFSYTRAFGILKRTGTTNLNTWRWATTFIHFSNFHLVVQPNSPSQHPMNLYDTAIKPFKIHNKPPQIQSVHNRGQLTSTKSGWRHQSKALMDNQVEQTIQKTQLTNTVHWMSWPVYPEWIVEAPGGQVVSSRSWILRCTEDAPPTITSSRGLWIDSCFSSTRKLR